ncbi:hypothetical protein GU926_05860 [Nibribacter ruber]|uniref:Uncharacterized protein n=1 Tax=Nibribacter ruber TaxID=2698458 RepID=A0A6P1NTE0_9BACT|nr:hypothetical protein [Nibribacter ruber]QHL86987.1 hypothetical protein GU926_05860 [Nibribacter ruber]
MAPSPASVFLSVAYLLMGGTMAGILLSKAVSEFKTYTIGEQGITVYNYLTFTEKTYYSRQVRGFSISHFPSGGWRFLVVILYLENGKKLELRQFNFLNFKKIAPALQAAGYHSFGFEPYRWKFLNSRHFLFEGKVA